MPKTLVFDNLTLCIDGSMQIKWLKQVTDPETGDLLLSEPHRAMVDFEGDVATQLNAVAADPQLKGYEIDISAMAPFLGKFETLLRANPTVSAIRKAKIAVREKERAADAEREKRLAEKERRVE